MPPAQDNTTWLQGLLDEAAPGDDAYRELIRHAWRRLLRLTRKMLRNYARLRRWEQTEDVFQTAVLRLYRSLSEARPASVAEFFGLAVTQIRRTLIDLARHHFGPEGQAAHWRSDAELAPDDEAGPREPADPCRPETLEAWSHFHEAVARLPEDEREVFQLVWYGGLMQADVAKLLKVSVPTVQRRWYAAQIALYHALQGEAPPLE